MTTFSIRAFTGEDAEAVGTWRYPPPYGVYDLREDPEQEDDMRTAANWGVSWFAVDDGDGELIGYVEFHDLDGEVELGLGMRPDRTGLGLGAGVRRGRDGVRTRPVGSTIVRSGRVPMERTGDPELRACRVLAWRDLHPAVRRWQRGHVLADGSGGVTSSRRWSRRRYPARASNHIDCAEA
jgi:hypothetical protein